MKQILNILLYLLPIIRGNMENILAYKIQDLEYSRKLFAGGSKNQNQDFNSIAFFVAPSQALNRPYRCVSSK